jgi:crotonobetainyl-CoA:carnitine CoA-transferase CaiB-like acyl-CoA transferase
LRAARPSLIHCSISGYGESGPYSLKKAYDLLIQCETGLVLSTGTPDAPSKAGFSVADLATDPRFAGNTDRVAHHEELTAIIESSFADRTAEEVSAALEAAGIANARLRAPADLVEHPQLVARDRWRAVGTPGGPVDALLPVEIAGVTPLMGPVPALGEHTDAIRAEFAPDA